MKEDKKHFKKSDQKLLIGIAAVIVALIIVLCVLMMNRNTNTGEQAKWNADYLVEQMEQSGWDYLPEDPEQIREIAEIGRASCRERV